MKIVYHFDENRAYCGASEACRSPLEEDVYLIPAMATDIMPPATGKNECPVWENGKWTLKPDFRGKVYWLVDGSECTIDQIGEMVPENGLMQRPEITAKKKGGIFSRFFNQAE